MQRGWEFRNLIDATVNVKVVFTEVDLARFEFSMSQEIPRKPQRKPTVAELSAKN